RARVGSGPQRPEGASGTEENRAGGPGNPHAEFRCRPRLEAGGKAERPLRALRFSAVLRTKGGEGLSGRKMTHPGPAPTCRARRLSTARPATSRSDIVLTSAGRRQRAVCACAQKGFQLREQGISVLELALPQDQHVPVQLAQLIPNLLIAGSVLADLLLPEFDVG